MVPDKSHVSYTYHIRDLHMTELLLIPLSYRQVCGIQWVLSQTRDTCPTCVIHVIYTWLSYFWSLWAIDKCEGSKWGRISPGIHWVWSQSHDTCPTHVIHVIYTWLSYFWSLWGTDKCEGSKWGQILPGSNGHGLRHVTGVLYMSYTWFTDKCEGSNPRTYCPLKT